MADLTPMRKQYYGAKQQYPDCLIFFRLGDFYELFDEDAKLAAQELNLTLTTRDRNKPPEKRTPMCGVPYHAAENYIRRLIDKGYKVAICEQTEPPDKAKGLVDRQIIRVVTPGTLLEENFLAEGENNFLAALWVEETEGAGLCLGDLSTGEIVLTSFPFAGWERRAISELARFSPRELLLSPIAHQDKDFLSLLAYKPNCRIEKAGKERFHLQKAKALVKKQFTQGLDTLPPDAHGTIRAVGGLMDYLYDTQKTDLSYINTLRYYDTSGFLDLDPTARRNLELTETIRSQEKKGSLLWVLNKTRTSMGSRLLRSWLQRPLVDPVAITHRLEMVSWLKDDSLARGELQALMKEIGDLERLISRVAYGSAGPRDLVALSASLSKVPPLQALLPENNLPPGLSQLRTDLKGLPELCKLLDQGLVETPPLSPKEGNLIRTGFDVDVDQFREILNDTKGVLLRMENREKERTGIKSLKVSYNKVFGYYIEVSKSNYDLVPEDYIRKQTLVNCERFITQELKELEHTILSAQDRMVALEYTIFCQFRKITTAQTADIQRIAQAVAQLDVLCSFAQTAAENEYCMPVVDRSGIIDIKEGRHPVVEAMTTGFVPNDTYMDGKEHRAAIITGPNMAGKSTYMRQVALMVILAQMGSFVPAKSARIGIVDKIFTRIGASDDLAGGKSTFMVEMSEVAQLLEHASSNSLLILDEIGRGTSTYDGMSIARAVLEWCADPNRLGAKTLFATHYHELTVLEGQLPGVKNYNIAAKKRGKDIAFLRKILPGGADQSYGIEVAQLAGLPEEAICRAREILEELEQGPGQPEYAPPIPAKHFPSAQEIQEKSILDELRKMTVEELTPLQALTTLTIWKELL